MTVKVSKIVRLEDVITFDSDVIKDKKDGPRKWRLEAKNLWFEVTERTYTHEGKRTNETAGNFFGNVSSYLLHPRNIRKTIETARIELHFPWPKFVKAKKELEEVGYAKKVGGLNFPEIGDSVNGVYDFIIERLVPSSEKELSEKMCGALDKIIERESKKYGCTSKSVPQLMYCMSGFQLTGQHYYVDP